MLHFKQEIVASQVAWAANSGGAQFIVWRERDGYAASWRWHKPKDMPTTSIGGGLYPSAQEAMAACEAQYSRLLFRFNRAKALA